MKLAKKALRFLLKLILGIIGFVLIYALIVFILSKITVNATDEDPKQEVSIFIKTNGVHTDIVVPIKNQYKDWNKEIKLENTISKDTTLRFVGFGWGDKGFYLNTPRWADLKVSTACNAAFYLGTSAMHATFFKEIQENESCIKINISETEYKKLIFYIEESFQHDNSGKVIWIPNASYGNNDSFYEANGKYSLFYTCNSWANNALRASDQKAALWTLSDTGIFCHYR